MSEIEILSQLKTQLVNFLDELIEMFPNEPDFIIGRIFVKDQMPIVDCMHYIVSELVPFQEQIKAKNEEFFLTRNVLFEKFDQQKKASANHFKQMWMSGVLDKEDKETIWRWFRSFVYLGKKYAELKRG